MQEVCTVFEVEGVVFHGSMRCRDIGLGAYVVCDFDPPALDVRRHWLQTRAALLEAGPGFYGDEAEICLCCGVRGKGVPPALPPSHARAVRLYGTDGAQVLAGRYFASHPREEVVTICECGAIFCMVPEQGREVSYKAGRPCSVFTGLWVKGAWPRVGSSPSGLS